MKIKTILALFLLFAGFSKSFAQPLEVVSDGALISVFSDSVFIDGNFTHENNDTITNDGNIYLTGNWINNSGSNVFTAGTSGWLHLIGDTQTIGGTSITHFNNLELKGTNVKKLESVDAEIEDTLALNDREFSIGNNTVLVFNDAIGAVTRASTITGGFVSSTNDGGLSRKTLSTGTYLFPVGSSSGTLRYRPVDIAPNSASANTFKVRMANVNPTSDGYNVTIKDTTLCNVDSNYYHRIFHTAGTDAANVTIYFDAVADGNFQTIAHWQGTTPQWDNTNGNAATGSPFSSVTTNSWSDFSTNPFALAVNNPLPVITATGSTTFCEGGSVTLDAGNGFSSYLWNTGETTQTINVSAGGNYSVTVTNAAGCNGKSQIATTINVNPLPNVIASQDDTINLGTSDTLYAMGAVSYQWQPGSGSGSSFIVSPTEETNYVVTGTDANGCTQTDTVKIYVDTKCVYWVPNIFSPNGDGENDELKIFGRGLEWVTLTIFDRWGNKVFESNDINTAWDGKYKGDLLNTGVYVYILKGICDGSGEEFEDHGNITLTR